MSSLPLYDDDQLDELDLDDTLLARAREAHGHDHDDELGDISSASELRAALEADPPASDIGFDPAETPMSILEAMQRDQEAEDARHRQEAEKVIAVVGRISKYGFRAVTGQRTHHRREH